MKAVFMTGLRQMELGDIAEPRIEKDDDVLLKVEAVGVCGSDVHYYETGKIGSELVEYPFIAGHEGAATVVEVGKSVTRVKAGDRVAVEPAIICHECDQCKAGRENTCRNMRFLGCPGQINGCLCEYIVMPEHCCFAIGDNVSFVEAVLCEPLAIALYAVKGAQMRSDSDVAIFGSGPIGVSCLVCSRYEGIENVYMTEKIPERVDFARKSGATWAGNPNEQDVVNEILGRSSNGVDVAFECAGQQETLDQAVDVLRPGGKLMLIGIPRVDRISFVIEKLRRKEITVVNVRRQNACTQATIDLVSSNGVDVEFMATHKFALERTQEAFDMVADYRDGVVKAIIELR
jgi:L-iditol 2-dehydrogenase